ncbi:hypothetical protein [Streptomyces sp. NPDC000851]
MIAARMLPSRQTGDLVDGHWRVLPSRQTGDLVDGHWRVLADVRSSATQP